MTRAAAFLFAVSLLSCKRSEDQAAKQREACCHHECQLEAAGEGRMDPEAVAQVAVRPCGCDRREDRETQCPANEPRGVDQP